MDLNLFRFAGAKLEGGRVTPVDGGQARHAHRARSLALPEASEWDEG